MNIIETKNVYKSFGSTEVLRGIDFQLAENDLCALQGASGSGKSTLLYLLGGLDTADTGTIEYGANDLSKFNDDELANFRNTHVGFVFQFHFLLPSMNCLNNILLPAKIGNKKLSSIKSYVIELAKNLKVEHCLYKFPFQLSGGEQQRVNIIRALSLKPKLLLCDEPTGNLDSTNSQAVLDLLVSLSKEMGSTLLVVTHDSGLAAQLNRKITIEDGRIIG